MVPMFTCGLLRSNFSFAISPSAPQIKIHSNPDNALCLLLAPVLLDDFFRQRRRQLRVMRKVHRERRAALGAAAQIRGVTEHLRQRNFHADHVAPRAVFRALNRGTPGIQIAEHRGHVFFRNDHFHFHNRFEQYRLRARAGFLERHRPGDLERHFVAVHIVIAAVDQHRGNVHHREPRQDAVIQRPRIPASIGAINSRGIAPPAILSINRNRCSLSNFHLPAEPPPTTSLASRSRSSVDISFMFSWLELGIGCSSILQWPYWPLPPVCLMYLPSPMAFLRIVSRYATCGRPTFACTLYSRSMRSTIISRCNSPIPEISVCPVSGSVETRNVGSSCASRCIATPSLSWSAFVFGSMATEITGAGKSIFSRMICFSSSQSVSPVFTLFKPTQAQISPA